LNSLDFYTNIVKIGEKICARGIRKGQRATKVINQFSPTLYISDTTGKSQWRTIDGKPVSPLKFESTRELMDWRQKHDNIEGFEIYGYERWMQQWLTEFFPEETPVDFDLFNVVFIDIEVSSDEGFPEANKALYPVISITCYLNDIYYVWGNQEYETTQPNVVYKKFESESELLHDFVMWFRSSECDIVTGWNTRFFDLPYLYNRISRIIDEKFCLKLSPWNRVYKTNFQLGGQFLDEVTIEGVNALDYLEIYKRFTYSAQESYRLDNIAHVELGEGKLSFDEYSNLYTLHKRDYKKFIDYNIRDVELVVRMDDKNRFLENAVILTNSMKCNPNACFSQMQMWDNKLYDYLWRKKIVTPMRKSFEKESSLGAVEGAYVKDPHVGMHDWVMSFDLNSLYPHLIMQYNISPETKIGMTPTPPTVQAMLDREYEVPEGCTVTPNGAMFRTDKQGFLPEILQMFYNDRVKYKKKMLETQQLYENDKDPVLLKQISYYHNMQMARKISLNSAYGAIGNEYFRYYDRDIAEAITMSGQLSVRTAENSINKTIQTMLNSETDFIIAADTDSIYVNCGPLVEKTYEEVPFDVEKKVVVEYLDKVGSGPFQQVLDKAYHELYEYTNAFENKMVMKREGISDRGVWTAKKRYILNVWNNEGVQYEKPKLKVMGLESVRSSTPELCRDKLKEAYLLIMTKTEADLQKFNKEFRETFNQEPLENIAFPRSVKGLEKYGSRREIYKQGCPMHVRGSLLYNHYLKEKKLDKTFAKIQEGEKIKFVYLSLPNPIHENVIAMVDGLPEGFGLDKYVDRNIMYEKTFRKPLEELVEKIGWNLEEVSTLDAFWA
tara:strand:+ start:1027 stop:3534 length:2508 start_codon:yes stop_codon:yes gene_type:complete